jgi:hypothetical protein
MAGQRIDVVRMRWPLRRLAGTGSKPASGGEGGHPPGSKDGGGAVPGWHEMTPCGGHPVMAGVPRTYDAAGLPRRSVTLITSLPIVLMRPSVQDALKELRKEIDGGIAKAASADYTVRRCREDWLTDALTARREGGRAADPCIRDAFTVHRGADRGSTGTTVGTRRPRRRRQYPAAARQRRGVAVGTGQTRATSGECRTCALTPRPIHAGPRQNRSGRPA